ncbi:MAG: hypothetical protein RSC76_03885 [Oscillospiraceae bacterium]
MNLTVAVSVFAIAVSVVFSLITLWRSGKKEDAENTQRQTTVIVKLENISAGIGEIKGDMKSLKEDLRDHEARLIKLEEHQKAGRNIL